MDRCQDASGRLRSEFNQHTGDRGRGDDSCECSAAAPKVYCFADPCRHTQCADGGSCTASYCGGCNAFFRDASGHVLCSPCEDDRDCSYGQACVDGRCRSSDGGQAACEGDADCAADEFCASPTR